MNYLQLIAGPIVLALGLSRKGIAPGRLGAVWFIGLVVFLGAETSKLGNLVGFGTMMAVLAALGYAVAGRQVADPAWSGTRAA